MSTPTQNDPDHSNQSSFPRSRFANLIRQYSLIRGFRIKERCKTTQVHAFSPSAAAAVGGCGGGCTKPQPTIGSILSNSIESFSDSATETLLPYGLPTTESLEPPIEPYLKPVEYVDSFAELYRRAEKSPDLDKSMVYLEHYSFLCGLGDPKLLRRCLQSARQHAVDVHSKVVLSAWLRYERRDDELVGKSAMDCIGRGLECPKASLLNGYDPNTVFDRCECSQVLAESPDNVMFDNDMLEIDNDKLLSCEEDGSVRFCIGDEEVSCVRGKIAALSNPLNVMLYGRFVESRQDWIDFSRTGISAEAMRAVELFSRTQELGSCSPNIVVEVLSFANRFCCEEMKLACDGYLAKLVSNIEEALVLVDYAIEERASMLAASCLQVILRELPGYLYNSKVMSIFCSSEARDRLALVGHASFVLYYFLSQVSMEDNATSNLTVMLLERLRECATLRWQKALAMHQLGCVLLLRKEYKDAQFLFAAAVEEGHVYSATGLARAKYKQGQCFSAYDLINTIMSSHKPTAWMYQDRSFYNLGNKKILDLNEATRLDPTLPFPYKYRSILMLQDHQIDAAILEINRIFGFKVSSDCLELRSWFFIALEDYPSAIRDVRAILTLEPNYTMFYGKMSADHLLEVLSQQVEQWSPADCWMQLYDRWSSVDDIGSLAVIHQMLMNDPGKSVLRFRQSLLLLRLNCQKAAMRSLRLARNCSSSKCERLVYEGWILYDTGHREEAIAKAEESISAQRSFEAFFLKAYALADSSLDTESSSYVIELLEEALRCPSDGLRKGQALNNLGSIYVDCGKLDLAADCYVSALKIKHTRAHQGLARVYHLKNDRKAAYDEMTKLIKKAQNKASAYEKRSEYCDRDLANSDLSMATQSDPLRTYPYRYRAAVLMDDQRENEAVEELTKAIMFKPDLQMLNLRAAFHESLGDYSSALRDCEAALCLDPNHKDALDLYNRVRSQFPTRDDAPHCNDAKTYEGK